MTKTHGIPDATGILFIASTDFGIAGLKHGK